MRVSWARISITSAGLLSAGLLSGCGGGDDSSPSVSEDKVLAEASEMVKPKAGLYKSQAVLEEFDAPGLAPQDAARLRERFEGLQAEPSEVCLSQEEAEEGFEKFVEQVQLGNCAVERFETSQEFINASMLCSSPGGISSRIGVQGRGAAEESRITLNIEQSVPQFSDQPITFTLQIENERIGECKVEAAPAAE